MTVAETKASAAIWEARHGMHLSWVGAARQRPGRAVGAKSMQPTCLRACAFDGQPLGDSFPTNLRRLDCVGVVVEPSCAPIHDHTTRVDDGLYHPRP